MQVAQILSHGDTLRESPDPVTQVFNEGYRAQAHGLDMVKVNPYESEDNRHWAWRKGFIQAFKDSN